MKRPFRSKQEVLIDAPLPEVWAFSMDLTKILTFHPRVVKVDLLSGKAHREPGVAYQCHLVGEKHTCIEKDVEIVQMEKIITVAASIPAVIRGSELAFDAHKWRDFECHGMIPHTPSPHSLSQPPTR